jgi:hypothetical protein
MQAGQKSQVANMIECIFTIEYEICGNGESPLVELLYEPAEKLGTLFKGRDFYSLGIDWVKEEYLRG